MADKIVAIFVEGATEIEFYKAVISKIREKKGNFFGCRFEFKNIEGIGNFKNNALRHFKSLKTKNKGKDIYIFLCIDSDAFEFSKKPPIDKNLVKRDLLKAGAKKVEYIVAKKSIEDWFLLDLPGVLDYLGLNKKTKCSKGKTGQEKLKNLFSQANKVYVKGKKTEGFIEKLDVMTIFTKNCTSFKPLCRVLKLECNCICKKK